MSSGILRLGRQVSDRAATSIDSSISRFDAYAVWSRSGPHVTMQAGVVHAGRFWTTTSRSSLKARSVDAHGIASAMIPDGDGIRIVAGRTTALSPLRPLDLTADPLAPLRAAGAVLRLGAAQAEQLVGYLEAAGRVPADWLPHRRVLLVTRIDRSITLTGHCVTDATGAWAHAGAMTAITPTSEADRLETGSLPCASLPADHRAIVRVHSRVHLGVSTPNGPVALPARWLGDDRFQVSAPALVAVDALVPGRTVAVFDESSSRRPDRKLGAMFRGSGRVAEIDGDRAIVVLGTAKVTTWDGFHADTTRVEVDA